MNPQKIVIIRPDRLGDLILSLPVAKTLKERFPDCRIYYLAAGGPAELKALINYVDNWVIDTKPTGGRTGLFELTDLFRREGFDYLIELKPSWRTAAAGFLSGIPARVGTSRRFYSFLYNHRINLHRRGSGCHQTDLDLVMLRPLGIEVSGLMPELSLPEEFYEMGMELVGKEFDKYIILHPGSGGSAPNWPLKHYIRLAALILESRLFGVVVTGAEESSREFPGCLDLRGRTGLGELAGILAGATAFVSGSTGPLHLADSLAIPCVSFFVDRDDIGPERWGPRRNMQNVIMPPIGRCKCPDLRTCHCLETITPEAAFKKIGSISGSLEWKKSQ